MRLLNTLVLSLLATAFLVTVAPSAAASTCEDREILYAGGGSTDVSANDCRYDMYYTVQRDGLVLVPGFCEPVGEVRVLGQTVPGTGSTYCVPDVGVPAIDQRTPDVPGVHICLTAVVLGVDLVPAGTPCVSYCKPEAIPFGVTCWYYP